MGRRDLPFFSIIAAAFKVNSQPNGNHRSFLYPRFSMMKVSCYLLTNRFLESIFLFWKITVMKTNYAVLGGGTSRLEA